MPAPSAILQRQTGDGEPTWYQFDQPTSILQSHDPEEVCAILDAVQEATEQGSYACGYVAYEAAEAFDVHLKTRKFDSKLPLIYFALFDSACPVPPPNSPTLPAVTLSPDWPEETFIQKVAAVKEWIARGHTYQVNLCYPHRAPYHGSPEALFQALCRRQAGKHHAYLDLGDHAICSLSPELFFRSEGDTVTCRPMKGTARRHAQSEADEAEMEALTRSEKNQAENVMIVDMIRNDLGKIAVAGSVDVPALYRVEAYPTVYQLTSTVTAKTRAGLREKFEALFPCASITGAPKQRTMELIAELETSPRGIYTGAIGSIFPGGDAEFNVAIRTAIIDKRAQTLTYAVGCGIVWDSDPACEYAESQLKASILHQPEPYQLLETMLWTGRDGFPYLDDHLRRLRESAHILNFQCDEDAIRAELTSITSNFDKPAHRVRLALAPEGVFDITHVPFKESSSPKTFAVDSKPTRVSEIELAHKTTRRGVYQQARDRHQDADETLLVDEQGHLLEFTIGNLILEIEGKRYTPDLAGCLNGTTRQRLLREQHCEERRLIREDLKKADRVFLCNAVRGLVELVQIS